MTSDKRPLAVVTGASSGIGYELARCCGSHGFDLIVVANEATIEDAAESFRSLGTEVEPLEADLATAAGVDAVCATVGGRAVDALLANAGIGLGKGFLDQDFHMIRRLVDTNITGTLDLLQRIGIGMRQRQAGRILITGSIAGGLPGSFEAVYSATEAFLDSFTAALRHELTDCGVTVTCLMPGATDTNFFTRADMLDTRIGQQPKDDPVDVARQGFDAMMRGQSDVVSGWKNRLQDAVASITPLPLLAELHRKVAEPGSAKR